MLSEEDIANLDDEAKANYEADVQERQALKNSSRWILPAKSQISLAIEFASKQTGKSDSILEFEIVEQQNVCCICSWCLRCSCHQ